MGSAYTSLDSLTILLYRYAPDAHPLQTDWLGVISDVRSHGVPLVGAANAWYAGCNI